MARHRLLILGGTTEAVELARCVAGRPVIYALAGRTRAPVMPPVPVRIGGFGGVEGLAAFLRAEGIGAVVDATHPFAATISAHAAEACARVRVPRLRLERPAWQRQPGDRWIEVADIAAAAAALPSGARAFLAIGRQELAAFAARDDLWALVRVIDPPERPLPLARCQVVTGRGPFDPAAETALLAAHGIDHVVAKNSGGAASYAKIAAARALGVPVILVRRPEPPPGPRVASVAAALDWLDGEPGGG